MASLLEGKSWGVHLVQLCAKFRYVVKVTQILEFVECQRSCLSQGKIHYTAPLDCVWCLIGICEPTTYSISHLYFLVSPKDYI